MSLSKQSVLILKYMAEGKGATSTLSLDALEAALEPLGFSFERLILPSQILDSDGIGLALKEQYPQVMQHLRYNPPVWGYSGWKEPKEIWFVEDAEGDNAYEILKTIPRGDPKGPTALGALSVVSMTPPAYYPENKRSAIKTLGWKIGTYAFQMKAPNGAILEVNLKTDTYYRKTIKYNTYESFKSPAVWKFLAANGGKALATKALASEAVKQSIVQNAPVSLRTLDGTGTCQICRQNVKMTSANGIMRHGWAVQGDRRINNSWHTGPCYGFGGAPLELSCNLIGPYLDNKLLPLLKDMKADLRKYKAGDVVSITVNNRVITPETPHFKRYLENAITGKETEIRYLERDIADNRKIIANWEVRPLPSK